MGSRSSPSEQLIAAGQASLAAHLNTLDGADATGLTDALELVGWDTLATLRAHQVAPREPELDSSRLAIPSYRPVHAEADPSAARAAVQALRAGKVAFALLAGGQASRLGWDGPKGTYPIGPQSSRSLFQLLLEHLVRAGRDFGTLPPLAVTTGRTTDAAIRSFFQTHDCFGYEPDQLQFSMQASLPALDRDGQVLLRSPRDPFLSPDGHGGAILGLETNGVLRAWEDAGIECVVTFQVDNPLLRVVDLDFIGALLTGDAPLVTKIIEKRRPDEKLGVVVLRDGRPALIEYSELPSTMAAARTDDGRLAWRLGSMAVHAFRLPFLRGALEAGLPLHVAQKQVSAWTPQGVVRQPGLKFERFLFDLFPQADSITVVESIREEEFAPLKNATGADSPQAVRAAMQAKYRRWFEAAGRPQPEQTVELSPLEAVDASDLR